MHKYPNKRVTPRASNGRFMVATGANFGIGAACPVCRHVTIRYYDGDPTETIDPRRFRMRCYTCEPMTDEEKAAERAEVEARAAKFQAMFRKIPA